MNRLIVEQGLGERVHVVLLLGLEHIVSNHRVEHRSGKTHAVVHQYLHVVLDVLTYLQNFCAFIQRFEDIYNSFRFFTFVRNCDIKRLSFLYCEAQTHQFCVNRIG